MTRYNALRSVIGNQVPLSCAECRRVAVRHRGIKVIWQTTIIGGIITANQVGDTRTAATL
jgi:hypothetical protein